MKNLSTVLRSDYSYSFFNFTHLSRQQAIDEGYLVDIATLTEIVNTHFTVPVALTREVYELCVAMDHSQLFKERLRLSSLLSQMKTAMRIADRHASAAAFDVKMLPYDYHQALNKHRLWVVVGPGDNKEPVLTVMLDSQYQEAL